MLPQADLKARLRIEAERGRNSVRWSVQRSSTHIRFQKTRRRSHYSVCRTARSLAGWRSQPYLPNPGIQFIRLKAQSNGPRRVAGLCCRYIHSPAAGKQHLSTQELGRYERTASHHECHPPPLTLTSSVLI